MPLVPLRPVLDAIVKYGYAQGAFNVNAVAQAEAVIAVHEMFRSPAILQGADLANEMCIRDRSLTTAPASAAWPATWRARCGNWGWKMCIRDRRCSRRRGSTGTRPWPWWPS